MVDFSLKDRVICITGASSGIGAALGAYFAETGAKIVAIARREASWCDGKHSHAIQADLSELKALPDIAKSAAEPFGEVDILINAAGLNPRKDADEVTLEIWQKTMEINLGASFFLAQAMVPAMKKKGWGRVINFASLQSRRAFANGISYGASKGGVEQLTRAMAEAWSKDGVNCNAIAPGFFPTELTAAVFQNEELAMQNAKQTCIGRNGMMDDLFGPVQFLASRASDYVTGQILFVDGGFTAK